MGMAVLDVVDSEYYKYQSFNALWVIVMLYGSVAAFYYVISAADMIMDLFVREPIPLEKYGAGKGHWAGCTDGVGQEMALQLADKGFNIVLLSPAHPKVEQLQKEIEAKGMAVKACVVDFVQPTKDQWQGLVDAVNEGHVSVLGNSSVVNNIGVCHAAPGFFDEEDRALCDDMVRANVVSTMTATRIVVPQMQAQGNGLILNMGSFAALRSLPFMSVYAGTKGFVKTFSQSLAYELEPDGITVSYIYGQWGIGSMLGSKGRSLFNPAPSTFVRSALDRIGLKCGAHDSHTSIPYYPHSIVNFVSSCLWDPMHAKLAHYGFGQHVYALGAEKRTHAAAE